MYYNNVGKTNFNLNDVFETIGRGIINFDPTRGFNGLNDNLSDVYEALKKASDTLTAKLDILEDDNGFELIMELPGVCKEDVKILANEKDSLEIRVTKRKPEFAEGSNKKFIHQERSFGDVRRTINFQKEIDKDNISAKWQNGELVVNVPKLKPAEPKEIVISIE